MFVLPVAGGGEGTLEVLAGVFPAGTELGGADLVLTGEGSVDEGTREGKVVHGVWRRGRRAVLSLP